MNISTYETFQREFSTRNNRGEGDSVGEEGDDINLITGLGRLVASSRNSDEIAIYQDGDTVTLVGDAHGPWAITAGGCHESY